MKGSQRARSRRQHWTLARVLRVALVAVVLLAVGSALLVQARTVDFILPWWTVDGGGGASSGAGFTLNGTVGQADAGQTMLGGPYVLRGGYWSGEAGTVLYLPYVRR